MFPVLRPASPPKDSHQLGPDAEEISMPLEQVKNFLPVGWFELVDETVWSTPTTFGEQDFRQHPFFQVPEEGSKRAPEHEEAGMEMEEDIDGEYKCNRSSERVSKK